MAWSFAVREFRFWLTDYRRTWRGSIFSSVLNPLLYLAAMGLGLGTLVNAHGTARLGGLSYLAFLAPGLLAAGAMQSAIGDATWPVYGSVKWGGNYIAAAASPLSPGDIYRGHLMFITARIAMNCAIFLTLMSAFGAARSPEALLALPASVLTGLAFAAPVQAWAITRTTDGGFNILFRFGMIPLFLFSGTFFPVTQLPSWIRPLAYVTPLWHGVTLCRELSAGTLLAAGPGGALVHVGYLAVVAAAGLAAGTKTYRRRLYV
jgi:lipooligosaccharide transport system permease protein